MIAFSNLLHYTVVDKKNKSQRLVDLAVDLAANLYPPVTHIILHDTGRKIRCIPWTQVQKIEHRHHRILVNDLTKSEEARPEWQQKAVFLSGDVLDRLMIDIKNRSTVMANDLWLDDEGGRLKMCFIDVGFRAILRRLSAGLIARGVPSRLRDWKYIEFLRGNPEAARQGRSYHRLIDRLPAGEIAYLTAQLPYLYAAELITLLPDPLAADTMEVMVPDLQLQVFEELEKDHAIRLLTLMRPDIASDLISSTGVDQARGFLDQMPQEQARRVIELMRYPEETVGGIMTNDMVTFAMDMSVKCTIEELRQKLEKPDYINFIQVVYVVNNTTEQKLKGALQLRDLLIADPESRLEDVMNSYQIGLHPLEPAVPAARRVIESALAALPVVEKDERIIGVVTIDTALDLVNPQKGNREILRLYS